jgi:hypothetical protein
LIQQLRRYAVTLRGARPRGLLPLTASARSNGGVKQVAALIAARLVEPVDRWLVLGKAPRAAIIGGKPHQ